MKTLALLVLVYILCHISASPVGLDGVMREGCCSKTGQMVIPKKMVKHVVMMAKHCQPRAIIVTTVKMKKICLNPDWIWAKNLWDTFQKSSNTSSRP